MIAPKQHTKDVVMEWLNREGLSRIAEFSPRSDSVVIEGSIKQIERLLKSEYKAFGRFTHNCYRIPAIFNVAVLRGIKHMR